MWLWVSALVAIAAASFWLRAVQIEGSMPYPRHTDEGAVLKSAARIVTTGDYHPTYFTYPSLPIYLAATGLGLGVVRAAANLEIRDVQGIGSVSYPYYSVPTIAQTARQLFALLSVLTLVAAGVAAFQLVGERSALVVAPLTLTLSPYFFVMSWRYVNVDISGACFATLCLAATLTGTRHPSMRWLAIIPGVCAGLAAGSKYIHGLTLLTVLLGIWLFMDRKRRRDALFVATIACGLTFVATSPYVVLDLPTFIDGLAFNARHYALGHAGYEGERGLAKLGYYGGQLLKDFGPVALIVSFVAIAGAARSDWRRTLVLLSFPLTLLALLSTQRVEFARNILPLFPWVAVAVATGLLAMRRYLMAWILNRRLSYKWQQPAAASVLFLLFLVAAGYLLARFPAQIHVPPESRVDAVAWIQENATIDHAILVPEELGLDARPPEARGYNVVVRSSSVEALRGMPSANWWRPHRNRS